MPAPRRPKVSIASRATLTEDQALAARNITEKEFWSLVEKEEVNEVIISSWSGKQLLAQTEGA